MKSKSHQLLTFDQHNLKIVFFGTPKIGAMVLEKLILSNFKPVVVVTREDKPQGRKQLLSAPPVKLVAKKHKIDILQPKKLKENPEIVQKIKKYRPDLAIVAAYGRIIPKEMLDIPKLGFLNVHPSLLPQYRGASPIHFPILDGAKITGVTIMIMDEELDHGPVLAQQSLTIDNSDTTESLSEKLAILGANLLVEILPLYITWKQQVLKSQQATVYSLFLPPKEQDHNKATMTKILTKEDGYFDITNPPNGKKIEQMIRAFYPWPGVWTKWQMANGKWQIVKLLPGNPIKIQPEGKKPMTIKEFVNGHPEAKELFFHLLNISEN